MFFGCDKSLLQLLCLFLILISVSIRLSTHHPPLLYYAVCIVYCLMASHVCASGCRLSQLVLQHHLLGWVEEECSTEYMRLYMLWMRNHLTHFSHIPPMLQNQPPPPPSIYTLPPVPSFALRRKSLIWLAVSADD